MKFRLLLTAALISGALTSLLMAGPITIPSDAVSRLAALESKIATATNTLATLGTTVSTATNTLATLGTTVSTATNNVALIKAATNSYAQAAIDAAVYTNARAATISTNRTFIMGEHTTGTLNIVYGMITNTPAIP